MLRYAGNLSGFCSALLVFLFLLLTPRIAKADTDVTVNDILDRADPSPNIGDCSSSAGTCTLRAAIQRANHRTGGTHTIRLPAGRYQLTRTGAGENDADTGDLDIKGNIVIIGTGAKSTIIDGRAFDRVFDVRSGSLLLQDVKVTSGLVNNEDGGGIRATANLTINRVELTNNVTLHGLGGGIFSSKDLSVVRSTISNNSGGAGGINAQNGLLLNNISIRESTIANNTSVGFPGGLYILGSYHVLVQHATIAFNSPTGIYIVAIIGDTVMHHTILAQNGSANCEFQLDNKEGDVAAENIDSDGSCGMTTLTGNQVLVNPQVSILNDNGGQTLTILPFSPIVRDTGGSGSGSLCITGIDQRGFPRPVSFDGIATPRCDIGALELQGPAGIAVLDPENSEIAKKTPFQLNFLWRVPPNENWHDLKTLDLRVVDPHKHDDIVFWLRWTEAGNTFQLVNPQNGQPHGPSYPAGADRDLSTDDVTLDLRHTSTEGSGPTGTEVTLHLALTFEDKSNKKDPYSVEVTGVDDHGVTQPFLAVGSIAVTNKNGH